MKINKIKPSTVRQWQNKLLSHEKGYTLTYLKTVNNQLSAIFNFAMRYYKLPTNPAKVCGSMGKKNADSFQFWTIEEFQNFIKCVSDDPTSKALFNILFWTGIRSGELLALTLNDFNFETRTVSINKSYSRLGKNDLIQEPKTPKSKREITIPKFLCELIKEYVGNLYEYNADERLFQVAKHHIRQEMDKGCDESNVKRIRVHDLRHSHASLLIEEGFSPILISERLGHDNIETTLQTYSHLYPNKHNEVAERLDSIIDNYIYTDKQNQNY